MSIKNMISVTFTETELKIIDEAITDLRKVLKGKTINLTPKQRQQYGSIAEENKLFVNKAKQYMEQYPEYVPEFLSKDEFDRDYASRVQIEGPTARLNVITEQLNDTKTLLDYDNYSNAATFYRNIRFLSDENVPGISTIYNDLKQFFPGGPGSKENDEEETPKE